MNERDLAQRAAQGDWDAFGGLVKVHQAGVYNVNSGCLVLACLTPYIGWFILTPAPLSTAIGAGLLTFFQRKPKKHLQGEKLV